MNYRLSAEQKINEHVKSQMQCVKLVFIYTTSCLKSKVNSKLPTCIQIRMLNLLQVVNEIDHFGRRV